MTTTDPFLPALGPIRERRSPEGEQPTFAEESKARSAEPLTPDHLDPIDVAFLRLFADSGSRDPLPDGYRASVTLTDDEMATLLAPAGLHLIERRSRDEVRLPPLPPYHSPGSAGPEHGRFDSHPDEIPGVDDLDMPDKVNASWFRMATEYGLFNEDREFLLAVTYSESDDVDDIEEHRAWVRVRLLDEWDWVASEVDQLRSWIAGTFTTRFVPEFTVVSLDGRMMMNTTVWGNGTVSTIAIRPE
ncbi:hypothetical protein [Planomonospora venezuelensis]|uniref:Uncharacterized protein n=1 Tax=Planomonospora venezuelensis TaxID=1999 RepID=A0A841D2V6_PLAVE|nr:hypothetical protein [Planomonospora venezuelensis]MBB5962677.1 hypothetical protein [Planomonospora venezuelensis]